MKKVFCIASILPMLALVACGNSQKASNEGNAENGEATAQETVDNEIAEEVPEAGAIDWSTVMPEIVKHLPKETIDSYFHGKIGNDQADADAYSWNIYGKGFMQDECRYDFTALALPYADGENVLVIANSEAGVDGMGTLLLKSMNYNLKTKEFSDISDKIPGFNPSAELLDLSWLSGHPDWVKQIKDSYVDCSTISFNANEGPSKEVTNTFNDNDVCYLIYDEMGETVPDWYDRLILTYVWNGKAFELKK